MSLEVTRESTRRPESRGSNRRRLPHDPLARDESRADGNLRRGTAAVSSEVEPTQPSGGADEGGPRPTPCAGKVSFPGSLDADPESAGHAEKRLDQGGA